jgi:hypothetical protein
MKRSDFYSKRRDLGAVSSEGGGQNEEVRTSV